MLAVLVIALLIGNEVWSVVLNNLHRDMSQQVTQSSHEQVILVHVLLSWFLNLVS